MGARYYEGNTIQKLVETAFERHGWTQDEAARKLGIATSYVQQVLKGAIPGDDKLVAMAPGLQIDAGLLVLMARRIKGGAEVQEALDPARLQEAMRLASQTNDPTPPDWLPGKEEDEIVQLMRDLSMEEKKRLLAMVRAFVEKPE